jgi:hypothetical protein
MTDKPQCWRFALVGWTGRPVRVGTTVTGVIVNHRLVVSTETESVGFAPKVMANEMIDAVRATGSRLRGRTLATDPNSAPKVELCLSY